MFDGIAPVAWFAWVALLAITTSRVWQWHLDYFKSPGEQFHRIALILIPALALSAWIYAAVRRKWIARREPALIGMVVAAACLFYEPRASVVVCALFLSCSATGRFVLQIAGVPLTGALERICVGFGAGAGILNVVLLVAGLAGLLYPTALVVLLAAPLVLFWRNAGEVFTDFRRLGKAWGEAASVLHPLTGVATVFALVAVICTLMMALAPSVAFDPLAFHLPLVKYYASTHELRAVPGIDYSLYPQGMELLWTVTYSLAGQPGAQLTSALFFPLFTMALLRLARACGLEPGAAVLAAVFAATMPFLHWSGSVMKNDLALAFYEALALLAFLCWLDGRGFRLIILGTFFLTQAFGIKLVALFGAAPLALLYGYAAWREQRRWRAAAILATVFLAFGTCWVVRDYWLTGNPVAPERLGMAVGEHVGRRTIQAKIMADVEAPWTLIFDGLNAFESPLPNPAGILLFGLAPLAILGGRIRPQTRAQLACAIFTFVYLIYWGVILEKLRYAILPFALLAVWLAGRLWRFYQQESRAVRVSLIAVATYCLLIATMGLMIVGINGPQFAYFAGRLDKSGYLRAAMRVYGSVEFLRESVPVHARIFGVENLARAYSSDASSFEGMLCPTGRPCDVARVVAAVRKSGAEYLILPEGPKVPAGALEQLGSPPRVYRDPYYSVYHLTR